FLHLAARARFAQRLVLLLQLRELAGTGGPALHPLRVLGIVLLMALRQLGNGPHQLRTPGGELPRERGHAAVLASGPLVLTAGGVLPVSCLAERALRRGVLLHRAASGLLRGSKLLAGAGSRRAGAVPGHARGRECVGETAQLGAAPQRART